MKFRLQPKKSKPKVIVVEPKRKISFKIKVKKKVKIPRQYYDWSKLPVHKMMRKVDVMIDKFKQGSGKKVVTEKFEKATTTLDLKKPADIHQVTNGVCFRPDIFLNGGRYCDNCHLYEHCQSNVKRLKNPKSQPPNVPMFVQVKKQKVTLIKAHTKTKPKVKITFAKPKPKVMLVVSPKKKPVVKSSKKIKFKRRV